MAWSIYISVVFLIIIIIGVALGFIYLIKQYNNTNTNTNSSLRPQCMSTCKCPSGFNQDSAFGGCFCSNSKYVQVTCEDSNGNSKPYSN